MNCVECGAETPNLSMVCDTCAPEYADAPRRIQLRRTKGWRMPPNTVKVDRTTKWGNPHDWREWRDSWPFNGPYAPGGYDKDGFYIPAEIDRDTWCRGMSVQAFEEDIRDGVIILPFEELRGKNLGCWCPIGGYPKSCHADVLLELANAPQPDHPLIDDTCPCPSCTSDLAGLVPCRRG